LNLESVLKCNRKTVPFLFTYAVKLKIDTAKNMDTHRVVGTEHINNIKRSGNNSTHRISLSINTTVPPTAPVPYKSIFILTVSTTSFKTIILDHRA
jgi:hypothetical protein